VPPRETQAALFRYRTSYRFYTLAKIGFCAAYLWYVWDFFWIYDSLRKQPFSIVASLSEITFSGNSTLDIPLRAIAMFLNTRAMVWVFLLSAPFMAAMFIWGRYRWLQFAVAAWISLSMIALACIAGEFISNADIWINYVFVTYGFTALILRPGEWEKEELGFSPARWRENPVLLSTYAWLVVLVQFTVYFFAGLNKLIYGWEPWTTGVALQNLAYDSSMNSFVLGIYVPYWISLILCYVTLFQRLVVPFGFFLPRFRIWSVLILGSMHLGYAILMRVTIFPLIGIASLLMILPAPAAPRPQTSGQKSGKAKKYKPASRPLAQSALIGAFSLWLLCEPVRLVFASPYPWEGRMLVLPTWRMFADGGVSAGKKWRIILETSSGEEDATSLVMAILPHRWRDRFYIDTVLHDILGRNLGPNSLPIKLLAAAEKIYNQQQVDRGASPVIIRSGFEIDQNHR
jgi:hypothetical protein